MCLQSERGHNQGIGIRDDLSLGSILSAGPFGFGDIRPMLPLSRMLSVITSVAGPLYLAAVMGVLIGRYASSLDKRDETS